VSIEPLEDQEQIETEPGSFWRTLGPSLIAFGVVGLIVVAAISLAFQDLGTSTEPSTPVAVLSAEPTETGAPTQKPTATITPSPSHTPEPTASPSQSPSPTATPSRTPTATPTETPEPAATKPNICYFPTSWGDPNTWVQYTVKENDSLFLIAERAQIPLWTLVSANCFTEETRLTSGQVLWLPLLSQPTATVTTTPLPTQTAVRVAEPYPQPFVPPQPTAFYPWPTPTSYIPVPTPYLPAPTYPPPATAAPVPPAPIYPTATIGVITIIPRTPAPALVPDYQPWPTIPPIVSPPTVAPQGTSSAPKPIRGL
jgi:hypothetical protein